MSEQLNEKCAVVAVSLEGDADYASQAAHEMLFALQHRGTEASGIAATLPDGSLDTIRGDGMVMDVYRSEDIRRLAGRTAIGHNRYSTSGSKCNRPQPFIDEPIGFALAHNGNLPQTKYLANFLAKHNIRVDGRTDSEMMGLAMAQYQRMSQDLANSVELVYPLLRGAATCTMMQGDTVAAFRDRRGIRPGVIGELPDGLVVASETCALDIVGADYVRDIAPGEMVIINGKDMESRQLGEGDEKFDMFEIVYFMRPDSKIGGESIYQKRYRAGQELAKLHAPITDDTENVLVVPIPDTSVPAAEGYAEALGLQHGNAIVKNRYIGRTFMQPTNGDRQSGVRKKHNLIPEKIHGRDIIFVDDSIVRLNTMPNLVEQARSLGAKSVSVLVASPPVRFPDFYGIDTPKQSELAAANLTVEEMRAKIDCNYLGFLTLEALVRSTGMPFDKFNLSCFNGVYPIGIGSRKDEIRTPVSMEYVD